MSDDQRLPVLPPAHGNDADLAQPPFLPRRFAVDLPRSLREADTAARFAVDNEANSDITVTAVAIVICAGSTQADALQAAADWKSEAPEMEIHASAWARVPGSRDDTWEWHLTLTVSSRDPDTGEADGSTHHADRTPRR